MNDLTHRALRTDISGMPIEWVGYEEAVRLYALGLVAYTAGTALYTVHGGISSATGRRSTIEVNSIIATQGHHHSAVLRHRPGYAPPLHNTPLFQRDDHICLYCGTRHPVHELSRDHVIPTSRGGRDTWNNVVTACKRCNHFKGNRTPDEAAMELLAVPFVPTHAEYIYLQGRRILADQMDFLRSHFPRSSPLHARFQG
ncbi:MAG: HNH endonuclease [Gammaproteobacteria bacterium]